jgi:hypothetical protein
MSEISAPDWFLWFKNLGSRIAEISNCISGDKSLRIALSCPSIDFVQWAIVAGALNTEKRPAHVPEFGETVVAWVGSKMQDGTLEASHSTKAALSIKGIGLSSEWPIARVPDGTPVARTPRSLSDLEKEELRKAVGRNSWYSWYTSKCVLPVSLIGNKGELISQRDHLIDHYPTWLTEQEKSLLGIQSGQIVNPNKFQYFPVSVLAPQLADTRPWLRQMESRLVVSSSYTAFRNIDPYFQQGAPHIQLIDRRGWNSVDAHAHIENQVEVHGDAKFELPSPPRGVFARTYFVDVNVDPGHISLDEDLEEFEL